MYAANEIELDDKLKVEYSEIQLSDIVQTVDGRFYKATQTLIQLVADQSQLMALCLKPSSLKVVSMG